MNEQESQIHSMNVTLGTPKSSMSSASAQPHPWIVLVCSDLGFLSKRPEPVSAATLNDLFSCNQVLIQGTVAQGLPGDIAPFHCGYVPADVKDFSPAALAGKLPLLARLKEAAALLDAIGAKKVPARDGVQRIAAMDLPQSILRQLHGLLPAAAAQTAGTGGKAAAVDSILSMMDMGESTEAVQPQVAAGDLAAIVTTHSTQEVSLTAVISLKKTVDRLIATLGDIITSQPFYREKYASWNALRALCKAVGRNREVKLFLHSAPSDAAQRHFADALQTCALTEGVPDVVVWDYPVTTDTASLDRLEAVGAAADRYKSIVVASIDKSDTLFADIAAQKPLADVLGQPVYIPLRRLQQRDAARCISLCAPSAAAVRSGSSEELTVGAAWLFTLQWVVSCIENCAPFHLQNSSIMTFDTFAFPKLSQETAYDGWRAGITVLRPNGVTTPRVLYGDDSTPYGSLLFNLCVNRTARLTADRISSDATAGASGLERFLTAELAPFGIGEGAVSVTADGDGNITVALDAAETIAGFRVAFDFTFGSRS